MPSRNIIEIILQAEDKASGVLESAAGKLDKVGSKLTDIGGKLTTATLPIAAGLGASVYSAVQFDEAMTNVGAVLGKGTEEMEDLRAQVLAMGAASRAGPQKAAEAFYDIVGGVSDASTHMAILEASIKASEAGNADLGATTSALIGIMNSYGYTADQAAVVSDTLTRTVGAGVGTMDQFASALPQVTGLANSMGISFSDVASATAYLTTQGNTASQATTQLGGMMSALLNPSANMKSALDEMGFSSGRAAVEQLGLVGTYQALIDKFGIDAVGPLVGQMEAVRGVTALTDDRFTEFSNNFTTGINGATEAARNIQMESAAAQFDLLKSKMGELGIDIGQVLIPILVDLVEQVRPVIDEMIKWVKENPEAARTLLLIVGAAVMLGPLLMGLGTIASGLSAAIGLVTGAASFLTGGLGALSFIGGGLTTIVGGVGAALTAVLGPIGAVVFAVTGAIAAIAGLIMQWNEFNRIIGEATAYAQKEVQPMVASGQISEQDVYDQAFKSAQAEHGDLFARLFYSNIGNSVLGKAGGGLVTGGTPYVVGEEGPELFVPSESGGIIPNGAGGRQYQINVNVTAATVNDTINTEANAQNFGHALEMELRRMG